MFKQDRGLLITGRDRGSKFTPLQTTLYLSMSFLKSVDVAIKIGLFFILIILLIQMLFDFSTRKKVGRDQYCEKNPSNPEQSMCNCLKG